MCLHRANEAVDGLIARSAEARSLLSGFNLDLINDTADVIYLLDADLRLVAFNQGWVRFALANGGEDVLRDWMPGAAALQAVQGSEAGSLAANYSRVFLTGEPSSHVYECSSPDQRREYLQVVYPVAGNRALLVTNSLLYTGDAPQLEPGYLTRHGLLVQCSHCQRVARQDGSLAWDWIPGVSLITESISHTFCPYCLDHHYPQSAD